MNLKPCDVQMQFNYATWGFELKFTGNKGRKGDGDLAVVTLHFDASWLAYLADNLRKVRAKHLEARAETDISFKI